MQDQNVGGLIWALHLSSIHVPGNGHEVAKVCLPAFDQGHRQYLDFKARA